MSTEQICFLQRKRTDDDRPTYEYAGPFNSNEAEAAMDELMQNETEFYWIEQYITHRRNIFKCLEK